LFLTALGTSENIVLGLNTGADDYMVKPFKFIEFLARIKTLLRRTEGLVNELPIQNANTYTFLNLFIDDNAKTVFRDEVEINLTSTEYRLLIYFLQNKNIVLSRMDILENVWGLNFNLGTNVVDVYVNYLRKKIDQNFEPKLIHTVIGMGYIMKEK
jgi:two-component system copper resistance phosphate regulon response regulator CusR